MKVNKIKRIERNRSNKKDGRVSKVEPNIYEQGRRYIEYIRQVVGEELWDRIWKELEEGREVHHENTTSIRNSV